MPGLAAMRFSIKLAWWHCGKRTCTRCHHALADAMRNGNREGCPRSRIIPFDPKILCDKQTAGFWQSREPNLQHTLAALLSSRLVWPSFKINKPIEAPIAERMIINCIKKIRVVNQVTAPIKLQWKLRRMPWPSMFLMAQLTTHLSRAISNGMFSPATLSRTISNG